MGTRVVFAHPQLCMSLLGSLAFPTTVPDVHQVPRVEDTARRHWPTQMKVWAGTVGARLVKEVCVC